MVAELGWQASGWDLIMGQKRSFAFLFVLLITALLSSVANAQQWGMYGGNPQHTGEVPNGVQAMNSILWQTPIDLSPPYNGGDLSIHYGCPTISTGGTVVLSVRNGGTNGFPTTNDTYQIEGHSLATGTTVYTATTDYVDWMAHDWTPSMSTAIDSNDVLYYPGAGGTIYKRASANAASSTVTQLCFYGLANYNANPSAYASNVQIDTPIVVDSSNNIYFGFYVNSAFYTDGNNAGGLKNGIAKISSTGVGTWAAIDAITGDSGDEIQTNCEPAVSNDGTHLYFATKEALWYYYNNPKLVEVNTSNLAVVNTVGLTIPTSTPTDSQAFAYVMDDGTASPLVGPDGDVYFGVWYQNIARGFMLHYSGDLTTQKTASAFGWDDTAAVVPASIVPSYAGTSTYLICTKYNNYADEGAYGDGANKIMILDPNATETYTIQYGTDNPGGVMVGDGVAGTTTGVSYTTMKEVLGILGITSNVSEGLEGVREWCVNTVAIDIPGKGAVVNSEDGHTYRWDFATNTLTDNVNLEPPTGEAYTPTLASSDGIAISVNNATVFALWDGIKPSSVTSILGSLYGGASTTGTVNIGSSATGPGATIQFSSNNACLTVPASGLIAKGSTSTTFAVNTTPVNTDTAVTVTASRYGFTSTVPVTVKTAIMSTFAVAPTSVQGGVSSTGTITLNGKAGSAGKTITLTGSTPVTVPASASVVAAATSGTFTVQTAAVSVSTVSTIHATLGSTTLSANITVTPALLSTFVWTPTSVIGGFNATGVITLNGKAGPSGDTITLSGAGPIHLTPTAVVAAGQTTDTFTLTTVAVKVPTVEVVKATFNSQVLQASLTVDPTATISTISVSNTTPYMTQQVIGTVTLTGNALVNVPITATSGNTRMVIDTQPTVLAGTNSATFKMHIPQLTNTQGIGLKNPASVAVSYNGASIYRNMLVFTFGAAQPTLSVATLHAGQQTVLTVKSAMAAGVVPLTVNLRSGNATLAPVPATATIPAGASSTTVTITAAAHITTATTVPITVSISGYPVFQVQLKVEP
jgi:hypothetical protein